MLQVLILCLILGAILAFRWARLVAFVALIAVGMFFAHGFAEFVAMQH